MEAKRRPRTITYDHNASRLRVSLGFEINAPKVPSPFVVVDIARATLSDAQRKIMRSGPKRAAFRSASHHLANHFTILCCGMSQLANASADVIMRKMRRTARVMRR